MPTLWFMLFLLPANFLPPMPTTPAKLLVDFSTPESVSRWRMINDGVMGGESQSQMRWNPGGTATFLGTVSLANNGGFASVRTAPRTYDLAAHSGIRLRVRGDGHIYSFRFRTDGNFDGVSWAQSFPTAAGEWEEIDLPFVGFQPVFRGQAVPQAGPLDPASIRQLGFLIAEKQAGAFSLEIDWIGALAMR
jgi:hypothetical protein